MRFFPRLRALLREIGRLQIPVFAANASFFLLLSCLPLTSLLLALLPYTVGTENDLLALVSGVVPQTLLPLFSYLTDALYGTSRPAVVSVSALVTLWSASKGLLGILRALNAVCGAPESRGYLRVRLLCTAYTLLFLLSLVLTLTLHVWGRQLLALFLSHEAHLALLLSAPAARASDVPKKYLALTFDDGPSGALTEMLLDGLAERQVHATFFVCGYRIEQFPDTLVRIASKFKNNPPRALAIIVGKSGLAYRREEDGVYVVPITALCA